MAMDERFGRALTALVKGYAGSRQSAQQMQFEMAKEMWKEKLKKELMPEESELKQAQAAYYRSRAENPLMGYLDETGMPTGYEKG